MRAKGEDITVYGDGSQTRSFCYVSDLIDGIYRLMCSDYSLPVNIGNPDEMSVLEFAKVVIESTGSTSHIVYKELPVDDPKVRRPDIGGEGSAGVGAECGAAGRVEGNGGVF